MLFNALMSRLVVNSALIRITEHLVSVSNLLKLLLRCLLVVQVLVRMVFYRHLFECLLDICFFRILFKPHDFVVISWGFFYNLFALLLLLLLPFCLNDEDHQARDQHDKFAYFH